MFVLVKISSRKAGILGVQFENILKYSECVKRNVCFRETLAFSLSASSLSLLLITFCLLLLMRRKTNRLPLSLHLAVIPRLWSRLNPAYIQKLLLERPVNSPSLSNSHLFLLKHVRSHFLQSPLCVSWRREGGEGRACFCHTG